MLTTLSSLEPIARLTVAILFNSLWESALLAVVVLAILRVVPNASATTRYAAWCAALIASLLLPLAAISQVTVQRSQAAHSTYTAWTEAHAKTTFANTPVSKNLPVRTATTQNSPAKPPPSLRLPDRLRFSLPEYIVMPLFGIWVLAAILLLVRLAINLYRLERLKGDALPLPVDYRERLAQWRIADKGGRDVRLCVCDRIEVPVAVGLFDSMILIPQHLLDSLSQEEVDQIMLHELAHLRRADDWTNGLQRVIQALFFFNPAVLYIAQQLDLEREVACDDWVVRQTERVRPYASCLTKMAEVTAWPHRAMAAPGVFVTRRGLSVRVERLLRAGRDIRTNISFGPAGAVAAALVVIFFLLQNVVPSFAFTLPQEKAVASDAWSNSTHNIVVPKTAAKVAYTNTRSEVNSRTQANPQPRPQATDMNEGPVDVHVPAHRVQEQATTIHVPPINVNVPETNVHVPAVHVHVPSISKSSLPPDLVSNAVNMGLNGAAAGLRASSEALKSMHLTKGNYQGFNCVGCDYSGQNLAGHNFSNQRFNGSDFSHTDLHGANFENATLVGVDFAGANLRNVNFRNAKLNGCDMSRADTTGADFAGAEMVGCDVDAKALSASQARQWLTTCRNGCDFSGADLRDQDLRGISLTGVDLSDADLRGANLTDTKFSGVDFSGARLSGANVTGANFVGCDFSNVDLHNLDLSKAQFVGDKFDGSNTP